MSNLSLTEKYPGYYMVEGELTFTNINKQTLNAFKFMKGMDRLLIDLDKVNATDSAGLALMIEWIKLSRKNHIHLSFKNIPQQLLALARISGFNVTEYFTSDTKSASLSH